MANNINVTVNSIPGYGYNLSRTSYDVRQNINSKNIGVLKYNNEIRKQLLSRNIGKYSLINFDEGIGYISNVYSLESRKPFSFEKEGLLGYTHIYKSDYQNSINAKYDIGELIQYYKHGTLPDYNYIKWGGLYNDYTEYIDEVYGFKCTPLNLLANLFKPNKLQDGIGISSNVTIQSVLYDFLQYGDIKYALEKDRIGIVKPNPLFALTGAITTNINNFSGKDTSLGIISNQLYAHALHNSAKFNTLRNTNYITPEVYESIGNKLTTISLLSADYKIDRETGRMAFELHNNTNFTYDYDLWYLSEFESFSSIDPSRDIADTNNARYRNIIRNIYMPFDGDKYFNSNYTIDNETGRLSFELNNETFGFVKNIENSEQSDYESNNVIDVKKDISDNNNARYRNISRNIYMPFEGNHYRLNNSIPLLNSNDIKTLNSKIYKIWNEGDKGNKTDELFTNFNLDEFNAISSTDVKYGILEKTENLLKSHDENGIDTIIGRFHTSGGRDVHHNEASLLQTAVSKYGMSHGRNLLSKIAYDNNSSEKINNYNNPYCRVWTYHNQYSTISDLIRPFSEDVGGENYLKGVDVIQHNWWMYGRVKGSSDKLKDNSVLNSNGFVNITPTILDDGGDNGVDIRRCMFSIENLAWKDVTFGANKNALSKEQTGPNGGRIMWFPPYDLKFNENVNVNWNRNDFIGRGEQIYTYTNTERSGTLSFILLVDHPSILDMWKNNGASKNDFDDEQSLLRFFAGCDELQLNNKTVKKEEPPVKPKPEPEPEPIPIIEEPESKDIVFYIFYPNNFSGKNMDIDSAINFLSSQYESSGIPVGKKHEGYDWEYYVDDEYLDETLIYKNNYKDNTLFGLNRDVNVVKSFESFSDATVSFMDIVNRGQDVLEGKNILEATVQGFSSSHGYEKNNIKLRNDRSSFAKRFIKEKLGAKNIIFVDGFTIDVDDIDKQNISGSSSKRARCARVSLKTVNKVSMSGLPDMSTGTSNPTEELESIKINRTVEISQPKLTKKQKRALRREERNEKRNNRKNNKNTNQENGSDAIRNSVQMNLKIDSSKFVTPESPSIDDLMNQMQGIIGSPQVMVGKRSEDIENEYKEAYDSLPSVRWDEESQYFSMLKSKDSFLYNRIIDKIKYFTPAFHSITPEGFNARLSFLHQCTRQGLTNSASDSNSKSIASAGNLAFGRPPVCVLRIGDFYHTKIIIESVTIDYETPQWDMNPEGIGMQPMFARISLNFKFLGGSDLEAPISRLQNAITFNYYANQSIYDDRADNGIYNNHVPIINGTPWKP